MKFIFIAVNYNGALHTENYLQSLQEMTLPEGDFLEAIIVDNNSAADDLAKVQSSIDVRPFARLIQQDHNTGYFSGLNAGLRTCLKNAETLIIVGNNDLKFALDFLVKLKEVPCDKDIMVIAPNIITLDGRMQNPHVVSAVTQLELIKAKIYFSNYYIGQTFHFFNALFRSLVRKCRPVLNTNKKFPEYGRMRIKRGIGACYVLTPSFFHHHEHLDDRVFLWGEEALLSHQVESSGGCTLYDPSVRILHCESASVRLLEKRDRYEIVKASYKIYKQYL